MSILIGFPCSREQLDLIWFFGQPYFAMTANGIHSGDSEEHQWLEELISYNRSATRMHSVQSTCWFVLFIYVYINIWLYKIYIWHMFDIYRCFLISINWIQNHSGRHLPYRQSLSILACSLLQHHVHQFLAAVPRTSHWMACLRCPLSNTPVDTFGNHGTNHWMNKPFCALEPVNVSKISKLINIWSMTCPLEGQGLGKCCNMPAKCFKVLWIGWVLWHSRLGSRMILHLDFGTKPLAMWQPVIDGREWLLFLHPMTP